MKESEIELSTLVMAVPLTNKNHLTAAQFQVLFFMHLHSLALHSPLTFPLTYPTLIACLSCAMKRASCFLSAHIVKYAEYIYGLLNIFVILSIEIMHDSSIR